MNLDRPQAPAPYSILPTAAPFGVRSDDFADGERLDRVHSGDGENLSPHLAWWGFPPETLSFYITAFDPDAPVPAGWWHWTVIDIAPETTELPRGAGQSDLELPGASFHLRNDGGGHAYSGPTPPAGDRAHRYYFAINALNVDTLDLDDDATATLAAFTALEHTIARAVIMGTYTR
ncbi:YbhB/YbcL family Raf kinase inhibitor-like protein [Rarobacter faecitabidus]|uniref:PBP family phospholipid-binding protein n=1 Tax=Rarobacter faecitabidus TaxID=13243 RepID=A0A542ZVH3_RARFA|nr:YbhB/YbcL family Raf kinase inhibitor-like protein [Rarobacter faecitabidus]TQL64363.1 hypothetical protein FB461_0865 [Rarobacter faecitabidus]